MKIAVRIGLLATAFSLGACASQTGLGFEGQRTVFNNPYVPPVIEQGTIGPKCDETRVRRSVCSAGAILYPGRGRHALLPNGEVVRLTRAERRFLRDRADALEAQRDIFTALANGTPLPPGSPAWPKGRGASPPPSAPPPQSLPPEPAREDEAP